MVSPRCHAPGRASLIHLGLGNRGAKPMDSCPWAGISNSHEQGLSPPPLGGGGKGTEWLSSMVFPVCNMVVARRLGLHPEEDCEQQHYEKEEDGATDSQGHNHLCVCSISC